MRFMNSKSKNKISKNTIPQGFSIPMALVDLIPVVFFGLSAMKIGSLFHSTLFVIGSLICLISGIVKVLWKMIAAIVQKNIWSLFVQMRIFMPIGFVIMLVALIVDRTHLSMVAILTGIISFPSYIFFGIGVVGMILMFAFAFKMDSSDPKVNWIEQAVNGIAQICFFIGLLLV